MNSLRNREHTATSPGRETCETSFDAAGPAPTLVLGLGNDILSDDAVGLFAVRQLAKGLAGRAGVDVCETMEMGLALLDFVTGYESVILVDSIQTGTASPGTIHVVDAATLGGMTGRTPHFLGVGDTLALGAQLGLPMPRKVTILAVEVEDPFTLGTELTPRVQRALPSVVDRVMALLEPDASLESAHACSGATG